MKKEDAILYFGSMSKLAAALGINKSSVSQWGENIPQLRAFEIERISNGELKANFSAPSSSNDDIANSNHAA